MFTVHEIDRDGDTHKELLSTPYLDIAEAATFGLVRRRFPEESQTIQKMMDPETAIYMICRDGIPYRRLSLKREFFNRWRFEEVK